MPTDTSWDESQFGDMCWHDNHVHALAIRAGEHGAGELDLDLDYILEWLRPTESMYAFRLAPATLTFRGVYDLRIEIDYAVASAGMTPFSIDRIAREVEPTTGQVRWTVELNWPTGAISFIATGFRQRLKAAPVVRNSQHLDDDERRLLGA